MPANGWFKINGINYTPGMVVPFVADIAFNFSKLILNESKCQVMSDDSKLKLFSISATYGSAAVTIFDATKNPTTQSIQAS